MSEVKNKHLEGQLFKTATDGVIRVLCVRSATDIDVEFLNTGFVRSATKNNIFKGAVKDLSQARIFGVACIGVGPYKSRTLKGIDPAYLKWRNMIMRCYSVEFQKKYPCYVNCKVSEEWLNYQNFAKWFYENIGDKDPRKTNLDKDLLQADLSFKIYSKETCQLITAKENSRLSASKSYAITFNGVEHHVFGLAKFCEENNLNKSSVKNVLTGASRFHKGVSSVKLVTQ